jgi:hypothetical protein
VRGAGTDVDGDTCAWDRPPYVVGSWLGFPNAEWKRMPPPVGRHSCVRRLSHSQDS